MSLVANFLLRFLSKDDWSRFMESELSILVIRFLYVRFLRVNLKLQRDKRKKLGTLARVLDKAYKSESFCLPKRQLSFVFIRPQL